MKTAVGFLFSFHILNFRFLTQKKKERKKFDSHIKHLKFLWKQSLARYTWPFRKNPDSVIFIIKILKVLDSFSSH